MGYKTQWLPRRNPSLLSPALAPSRIAPRPRAAGQIQPRAAGPPSLSRAALARAPLHRRQEGAAAAAAQPDDQELFHPGAARAPPCRRRRSAARRRPVLPPGQIRSSQPLALAPDPSPRLGFRRPPAPVRHRPPWTRRLPRPAHGRTRRRLGERKAALLFPEERVVAPSMGGGQPPAGASTGGGQAVCSVATGCVLATTTELATGFCLSCYSDGRHLLCFDKDLLPCAYVMLLVVISVDGLVQLGLGGEGLYMEILRDETVLRLKELGPSGLHDLKSFGANNQYAILFRMYSRCHALSFVAVLRCYAKDLTVEFAGCTSPNQISWPQQPAGGRMRGGGMRRRGRADEWLRRRQRRRGHRQPRLRRRTRLLLGQQEPIRPQGLRQASGCMMCITDGLLVALCASLACSLKQRCAHK